MRAFPVLDSVGRMAGIVSRVDVLSVLGRPHDRIRGEVVKEIIAGSLRSTRTLSR
jgi:CBS domain-containing protein